MFISQSDRIVVFSNPQLGILLQLHPSLRRKADHLAQQIGVGGLAHHLVGRR